ncbi:MAG TPA: class I SAM-dependent methyltransferase [Thermoanaerobaculia bacterium]
MTEDVAARVAARYDTIFLQKYTRSKVRHDPVYPAVRDVLRDVQTPLVDVGCGAGVFAFFLRESGFTPPITGIDFHAAKIAMAQRIAPAYEGLTFRTGDARREELPAGHSVLILDVLQYVSADDRAGILEKAARAVPPGGVAILRQGIRDASWRSRVSYAGEVFSRINGWLKMERIDFPTREQIVAPFAGFAHDIRPLWGRTPFNNYLFVFRRPA